MAECRVQKHVVPQQAQGISSCMQGLATVDGLDVDEDENEGLSQGAVSTTLQRAPRSRLQRRFALVLCREMAAMADQRR